MEKTEKTAKLDERFGAETMAESGKTVFAAWLEIPSGGSGTLSLEYENPNRLILKKERDSASFLKNNPASAEF